MTTSHPEAPLLAALERIDRRQITRLLAGLCLIPLVGCDDDAGGGQDGGGTGGDPDAAPLDAALADARLDPDAGPESDATDPDAAPPAETWATGGTAAMVDKARYPDPFTAGLGACALVATTTEGPCTTATDRVREDISEGWDGLPVRLLLKLVDTACAPLAGATVKVWHTNHEGSYSGQTPNNGMCLQDQSYSATDFFRGVQTADEAGVVGFDTCFPGWYRGRAIHIHFQVSSGGRTTRVSQLFFPEDITEAIFAAEPVYRDYGQPDTRFADDNILSRVAAAEQDRLILTVARMSDGAMLAAKVVTVA